MQWEQTWIFFFIFRTHATIIRASVLSTKEPSTKCTKCTWNTTDAGDSTAPECALTRTDMCKHSEKSGEQCYQCKDYYRFCECAHRIRTHVLPNGAEAAEGTGEHSHAIKNFTCGLSARCKEEIASVLTLNCEFKPAFIKTAIENKYHVTLSESERLQVDGHIYCQRHRLR